MHIVDNAGSVQISRPGQLQVFTSDHPKLDGTADVDESFSFDTFGASVLIKDEPCIPGGPVVSVVKGMASIALPMVGSDGSDGDVGIKVSFKLCSAKLYEASLEFSVPKPGIPVGTTGVGLSLLGGSVTIDPDHTTIVLNLSFQTIDQATLKNGKGKVTIDTRGMFAPGQRSDRRYPGCQPAAAGRLESARRSAPGRRLVL